MGPFNTLKYIPGPIAAFSCSLIPLTTWPVNYYSSASQLVSFESLDLCVGLFHTLHLLIMQIDFGVSQRSQRLLVRSNGDCQRSFVLQGSVGASPWVSKLQVHLAATAALQWFSAFDALISLFRVQPGDVARAPGSVLGGLSLGTLPSPPPCFSVAVPNDLAH